MLRQEILQHCLASFNFWVLPHKILTSSWHCVLVMFWFPKRHPPYLCESGLSVLQAKGRGRGMPRAYLPLRLQHKLGSILGHLPISFTLAHPPYWNYFDFLWTKRMSIESSKFHCSKFWIWNTSLLWNTQVAKMFRFNFLSLEFSATLVAPNLTFVSKLLGRLIVVSNFRGVGACSVVHNVSTLSWHLWQAGVGTQS